MHITANHCIELTCAQYVNDYITSVKFLFSHPFESWTGIYITHAHKALGNRNQTKQIKLLMHTVGDLNILTYPNHIITDKIIR